MRTKCHALMLAVAAALTMGVRVSAQDAGAPTVYPTAIFPFQERGREVQGFGQQVSDLLFAELVANPDLYLVDRSELEKALEEAELNLSGMVNPGDATQIGQLTGAKVLVTGSVMQIGKKLYLVAKIIGTETSRVLGASVKGDPGTDLDTGVAKLAEKVAETITKKASLLVAKPVRREDQIAALKEALGNAKRPTVYISISERHVGQVTIDPAAETELSLFCKETGFDVIDSDTGDRAKADLVLTGEGFSEFATRRGNLISVKSRVEIKAVDPKTDKVIAVDREAAVVVDLAEQHAGKQALQRATAKIAERLLPKLVTK